jgi:hypothetical protein
LSHPYDRKPRWHASAHLPAGWLWGDRTAPRSLSSEPQIRTASACAGRHLARSSGHDSRELCDQEHPDLFAAAPRLCERRCPARTESLAGGQSRSMLNPESEWAIRKAEKCWFMVENGGPLWIYRVHGPVSAPWVRNRPGPRGAGTPSRTARFRQRTS